jgi:NADPH:quinone reductase-like Zn-dependent oxidoreductase
MRQVWVIRAGGPEVLRVQRAPLPHPLPGEVRVRVAAMGVNFADIMGRLGIYPDAPRPPYVPGYEVAGRIDAVGEGVDPERVGQQVLALTQFGGYSEAVCVPALAAVPRPDGMAVEQAASFMVPYLTAYAALIELARVRPGDAVLIHAAAGGVGLAAVDLCRRAGATIYGTASASKHEFLRARGVEHPIDYRRVDFERAVRDLTGGRGVDIALDSVGGRSWLKSFRSLAPAGRIVLHGVSAMAPGPRRSWWAAARTVLSIPWIAFNPVALTSANKGVMGVNLAKLWPQATLVRGWAETLLSWFAAGELHPHVDRTFDLAEAAAAHRMLQERRNIGKLVLLAADGAADEVGM